MLHHNSILHSFWDASNLVRINKKIGNKGIQCTNHFDSLVLCKILIVGLLILFKMQQNYIFMI